MKLCCRELATYNPQVQTHAYSQLVLYNAYNDFKAALVELCVFMQSGHSTICYVNTTLKAQPFLLNTCCPGHPYVPVGTGENAPSGGD